MNLLMFVLLAVLFGYWLANYFWARQRAVPDVRLIVYTVLAVGLFALVAFDATSNLYSPDDVEITRALQAWRSPWLDNFMILIGLPGTPPQTLILNVLFVLIVLLCRLKPEALTLAIFVPTFGTLGTWLRCGINRPRPSDDLVFLVGELKDRNCSYPSGHTINFTVVLGFMFFIGLTQLAPSWRRNLLLSLYALYAILMELSRIYVGDHWASDVLAGYLLGSVFLIWMIRFCQWVSSRFFTTAQPMSKTAAEMRLLLFCICSIREYNSLRISVDALGS